MAGFFKIQREYLETSEWQNGNPFDEAKAWIDIVGRANYAEAERFYKGKYQRVHRGQLATSELELANRWNWSRGRVRRYLANLVRAQRVTIDSTKVGTIITVVNYDIYQEKRTKKRTTDGTQTEQQTDITRYNDGTYKRRIKKNKEEQNGIDAQSAMAIPTRAEVLSYVSEQGLDVDPDRFIDYYEALGWEINGRPMKNWKAACRRWRDSAEYKPTPAPVDFEARLEAARKITKEDLYGPTWNGGQQ